MDPFGFGVTYLRFGWILLGKEPNAWMGPSEVNNLAEVWMDWII
jgi:hypothetical protein